jgi:glycosyltransferase involved in cell wall biosynthesis
MTARRPVRVNFLIDRLSRAGTETQLLALIRSLDRYRVRPTLALLDGTDDESRSLEPADCPVIRLGMTTWRRPVRVARAARQLVAFWRHHAVDVVQTYFLDSTYFGVPLARAAGIRRVVRVRNNVGHWLTPTHQALGRVVGRLAHRTLTNSEPGLRALRRAEGHPPRKLVVLENGVDLDRFAGLAPPRRGATVTIGAIANLRPVKGIDVLIAAAARIAPAHPHVRFVVAGDGGQRRALEGQIRRHGLADRFRLVGQVDDVPALVAGLDVGVLPSRAEGMSNALLEFMAAGRPVVATAVGANPHLLADGRHGLLVPPDDSDALADALARLIADSQLGQILGESARRHAAARFSRAAMRDRFERFYLRLCA